jgi:hypothetical protein
MNEAVYEDHASEVGYLGCQPPFDIQNLQRLLERLGLC